MSLNQLATRATSTGSNSEPPSEADPASGPVAAPESDPEAPLDPEAAPELDPDPELAPEEPLDPEAPEVDPELLALDPDPELDPASDAALWPVAPPDEQEETPSAKATADQTVTWARGRMQAKAYHRRDGCTLTALERWVFLRGDSVARRGPRLRGPSVFQ